MKKIILSIAVLLLIIPISMAQIPTINNYITDNAGILSSDIKSQLETDLRNLEKETNGVQFVVYIENEYPKDFSLEEYTLKIAEQNKIGKKGNDNGILLYVAVKDRKYRWEVGYGVESTLNSALIGRISRDYLVPNFQKGDYEAGILQAGDIVKRLLLDSNDPDIVALKNESSKSSVPSFATAIIIIFVIIFVISAFIRISRLIKKSPGYKKSKDSFYQGAAGGLFMGGFGRGGGGFGGSGGFGGFSGGGGGFGGGGGSGSF